MRSGVKGTTVVTVTAVKLENMFIDVATNTRHSYFAAIVCLRTAASNVIYKHYSV